MGKVVPIGCITRLDLPVQQVLQKTLEDDCLESVVLIGRDKDGDHYFASTIADGGEVLWLIEHCKKALMEIAK